MNMRSKGQRVSLSGLGGPHANQQQVPARLSLLWPSRTTMSLDEALPSPRESHIYNMIGCLKTETSHGIICDI